MTSEQLFQYATVKIKCKDETGTALLYSLGESLDYMYILTAKHCLAGKEFDQEFTNTDISIEKIYNPSSNTWHSCSISVTDKVICSDSNELDLAIIIIPKSRIEDLSGISYSFQVVDQPSVTGNCIIRGFADFNSGEEDRPYNLKYSEIVKDKPELLILNFDGSLDTRYQSAVSNVQGLSGSGLFTMIKGVPFLLGTVHTYEEKNRFFATKITTFNYLLPEGHVGFAPVRPEENDDVIKTFNLININNEAIKIRTRDKVGHIHIPRQIDKARTLFEQERMVVFHGKAGVGKSALAKALIEEIE
ncbi:MAG: ATP-binding protein [Mucilaginibacter sp.]|nr:ATP-binding protein [Mucilaginibacter sp.]